MSSGWDPDVKNYLRKVLYSLTAGISWLVINVTAGIYNGLAFREHYSRGVTFLFYAWLAGSLLLLYWYLSRLWRRK